MTNKKNKTYLHPFYRKNKTLQIQVQFILCEVHYRSYTEISNSIATFIKSIVDK